MPFRKKIIMAIVLMFVSLIIVGQASAILIFPDPTLTALQYGDAYSYSLPILNYLATGEVTQNPGDPYYVASSPGQIEDLIVIATGASGSPVNTNFPGMNNAYPTPSGVSGSPIFSTFNTPHPGIPGVPPGAPFPGDSPNTWNTTLSALINQLTISGTRYDLVFFFNNNQDNAGSAAEQSLYAWAQASIVDAQGVLPTLYFDFTSVGPVPHDGIPGGDVFAYNSPGPPTSNYPFSSGPYDSGTWPSFDDFVLSGGQVCLDENTLAIVDCGTCTNCVLFNHNLGANQAAYALFAPELNAGLETWMNEGYDVMSLDLRITALNNGYEQLFIMPGLIQRQIPEPSSIVLLGSGLLGLGLYFRRKFRK